MIWVRHSLARDAVQVQAVGASLLAVRFPQQPGTLEPGIQRKNGSNWLFLVIFKDRI